MVDTFRVRISKVTEKKSGFTVFTFPQEEIEPATPLANAFAEQAQLIYDNWGYNLRGFVLIAISDKDATIGYRRDSGYPEHEFITHAKHILENLTRYSEVIDDNA